MNATYKQIIFAAILVFTFYYAAFAQSNENVNTAPQSAVKLLAEFNDTDNEWYKLTPDMLIIELTNNPSAIGLVRVKNDSDRNLTRRLRMLKTGFAFRRVDLSRITYLIADKQKHDTDVLVASSCSEMPKCEDCILIRATDIDKIGKLFRPKTTTKIRKKK
jgi:hypothetical protein